MSNDQAQPNTLENPSLFEALGKVTNTQFDGGYFVLCDAKFEFGGWDTHSEFMIDENVQLEVDGQRACIVGSGEAHTIHVFQSPDGALYATLPEDGGVRTDQLTVTPKESDDIGLIDLPSGELVVALAYPPFNMETEGDFAGVVHNDKEILRIPNQPARLALAMQHTDAGYQLRLSPADPR